MIGSALLYITYIASKTPFAREQEDMSRRRGLKTLIVLIYWHSVTDPTQESVKTGVGTV